MNLPSPFNHRLWDGFGLLLAEAYRRQRGPGALECSGWMRRLYGHRPVLEELLEEWYDRSAESCDLFDNISQVDRYSVTCTVCRRFEKECCSPYLKGPGILELLKATYVHDSQP